jgi:hypothetical protein
MPFSDAVVRWQAFYSVLAGVAATFAGLLFVSLSLHLDLLNRAEYRAVKHLARHTFASFVFLVVFSLVFLIPVPGPVALGLPLLGTGVFALAQTVRHAWMERRARATASFRVPRSGRLYLLAALTYVVLSAVAVGVLRGKAVFLYVVAGPLIWHLAWTTRSAWDLLVELRPRVPDQPAVAGAAAAAERA